MRRPWSALPRCRRCGLWKPSGECADTAIKSGRCGDWIWYVFHGKQCKRRYVRPKDPRTLPQLRSRGRLSAASKLYSQALPDQQQVACIAAGKKKRCRRRLGPSGVMTGHQYWVHKERARRKALSKATKPQIAPQLSPPQALPRPTSDAHRLPTGRTPDAHPLPRLPASKAEGRRNACERRPNNPRPSSQLRQIQKLTASARKHYRTLAGARPRRPARHLGGSLASRRPGASRRPAGLRPRLREAVGSAPSP
jgi:hypothetical protein